MRRNAHGPGGIQETPVTAFNKVDLEVAKLAANNPEDLVGDIKLEE